MNKKTIQFLAATLIIGSPLLLGMKPKKEKHSSEKILQEAIWYPMSSNEDLEALQEPEKNKKNTDTVKRPQLSWEAHKAQRQLENLVAKLEDKRKLRKVVSFIKSLEKHQ